MTTPLFNESVLLIVVFSMSVLEYQEKDEILKLRAAALKKEDANLLQLMEKLERERNIHIRELKRITAEDNSRYVVVSIAIF